MNLFLKKAIRDSLLVKIIDRKKLSFIIGGAQKSGTSSLHYYLTHHPQLVGPQIKETGFFHNHNRYRQGTNFLHKQFVNNVSLTQANSKLFFESTPENLSLNYSAKRIFDYNPKIKLIFILRNPVERAYSAWNMYRTIYENDRGNTILQRGSLSDVQQEIKSNFSQIMESKSFPEFNHVVYEEIDSIKKNSKYMCDFIKRGIYHKDIETYLKYFDINQILFIDFNTFKANPQNVLRKVEDFLEIETIDWNNITKSSVGTREYKFPMSSKVKQDLSNFYAPHNKKLFELLGKKLDWNK